MHGLGRECLTVGVECVWAQEVRTTAAKPVPKRPRKPAASESIFVGWGGDRAQGTPPGINPFDTDDVRELLKFSRTAANDSHFILGATGLSVGFLNYGFRLVGQRDPDALRKRWTEDPALRHGVNDLVEWVWNDLELLDNAVVFWRDSARRAVVVPPEQCRYTDAMGIERLSIDLGYKAADLKNLKPDEILRYARDGLEVDKTKGENFVVIKRARTGWGFARPRLAGLLRTLEAHESLEVFDQLWAQAGRSVYRMWLLGHEIRNGPKAGQNLWFSNKARQESLRRMVENRHGLVDLAMNFDTELKIVGPDAKPMDVLRYEPLWARIRQWLGPLGMLLTPGSQSQPAMGLFRVEAQKKREQLAPHLEEIIPQIFGIPQPIRVKWSSQCFNDPRIASEMFKFGVQSGPVSQRTFTDEIGLDTDEERTWKAEEYKLAQSPDTAGQVLPVFSPYQGRAQQGASGRPAGTRDAGERTNQAT